MRPVQIQQPAPTPAPLNRGSAGNEASAVPTRCFGIGCVYHAGCAKYAAIAGQHDDTEPAAIAFCWMKGAHPLYVGVAA